MLRVSATDIEQFRRCVQEEYASAAELEAKLRGAPFEQRWQASAGQSWHSILKTDVGKFWETDQVQYVTQGAYTFSVHQRDVARKWIGPGVWELKETKLLDGVTIVAKADHCHGLVIQDNKTKFSPVHEGDLEPSLQWRVYLWCHEAKLFRYNMFSMKDPDGGGYCDLYDIQSFRFWPYLRMESDIRRWLKEFLSWADSKGLLPYLERKGT
jgi:hypothetical protein